MKIFSLCSPLLEARVVFDIGNYRLGTSGLGGTKKTHRDAVAALNSNGSALNSGWARTAFAN
jgi:hypothetical protein